MTSRSLVGTEGLECSNFSEAYEKTHKFIRFYNEERIHGSIGDIAPAEAMAMYQRGDSLNIKTISM